VEPNKQHPIMAYSNMSLEKIHEKILDLIDEYHNKFKNVDGNKLSDPILTTFDKLDVDQSTRDKISKLLGYALNSKQEDAKYSIKQIITNAAHWYTRKLPPSIDINDIIGRAQSKALNKFITWKPGVSSIATYLKPAIRYAFNEEVLKANGLTGMSPQLMSRYLTVMAISQKSESTDPTELLTMNNASFDEVKQFVDDNSIDDVDVSTKIRKSNSIYDYSLTPKDIEAIERIRKFMKENPTHASNLIHSLKTESTFTLSLDAGVSDESGDTHLDNVPSSADDVRVIGRDERFNRILDSLLTAHPKLDKEFHIQDRNLNDYINAHLDMSDGKNIEMSLAKYDITRGSFERFEEKYIKRNPSISYPKDDKKDDTRSQDEVYQDRMKEIMDELSDMYDQRVKRNPDGNHPAFTENLAKAVAAIKLGNSSDRNFINKVYKMNGVTKDAVMELLTYINDESDLNESVNHNRVGWISDLLSKLKM